ncbi:MAG: dCTP deaminase [Spirochaetia bacterium]|nr:dCTP deaminase [Spirochaetia bacterium]
MILTGPEIVRRMGQDIRIEPYDASLVNPNSYNLRLNDELVVYKNHELDMKKSSETEIIKIPADGLVIEPGKLYLGRTVEYTETFNLVPMLEGRSSIGRLGLFVHVTAGFGDVGFRGYWTLEISAIQPIRIYPFVSICQIFYHTIEGEIVEYKSGKYQNNKGIQPSLLFKELEKT